jgi:hypothetical protein
LAYLEHVFAAHAKVPPKTDAAPPPTSGADTNGDEDESDDDDMDNQLTIDDGPHDTQDMRK